MLKDGIGIVCWVNVSIFGSVVVLVICAGVEVGASVWFVVGGGVWMGCMSESG